jgi:hypothetical protein
MLSSQVHVSQMPMPALQWILLAVFFSCATCAGSSALFKADDKNIYIITPGGNGTVMIDGEVDIKLLNEMLLRATQIVNIMNSTLLNALAVNQAQQVGH